MNDALSRLERIPTTVLQAVRRNHSDDLIAKMTPRKLYEEYCVIALDLLPEHGSLLWEVAMELKTLEDECSLELVNHFGDGVTSND